MRKLHPFFVVGLVLVAACGGDGTTPKTPLVLAPTQADIPLPNSLLFLGTQDGTVNAPVVDPDDPSDPVNGINSLDGFSTIAPIVVEVENDVRASTVVPGGNVRLYEMIFDPTLGVSPDVRRELSPAEFTAVANGAAIVIVPLVPLDPKTSYLALVTNGVRDVDGKPLGKSRDYRLMTRTSSLVDESGESRVPGVSDSDAALLEQIRGLTILQVARVAALSDIRANTVVASWEFRAQNTQDTLEAVRAATVPRAIVFSSAGDTSDYGALGIADVYVGLTEIPMYMETAPNLPPTDPLTTWWTGPQGSNLTQFNPMPVEVRAINIPVILTVPNAAGGHEKPASGWPVIVYQPGLLHKRTEVIAIADAFAQAGYAIITIDLPLHGETDPNNPFYMDGFERTFDLDLVNNVTGAPGPDGITDIGGTHFVNLRSLQTTRDNLRQATADLFALVSNLPNVDYDGGGADLDPDTVHFFGHSLGGVVGTAFAALEDRIDAVVLGMMGGALPRLLEGSDFYGPLFQGGLIQAGLNPGTPEYDAFFIAMQTIVDSADPVNYAARAVAAHPIYMMEIVGNATNPPDDTVPNFVPGHPLAGTEPLVRLMGLASVDPILDVSSGARGVVRYTDGVHSSHLLPQVAPAVTAEMLRSIAGFFASGGTLIEITDLSTIR
ncbi:MAG: hypothetical protein ACYTHK_13980 [Planctomycetota bacterium]|jgi:pimeloyl-ACP methyl ester carboxylesterase